MPTNPVVLALDSAGSGCSVVVALGQTVLGAEYDTTSHGQAERLLPLVDSAMRRAGLAPAALDIVAVTVGPGSFTGIRVGLAAARGIARATGAQLVGVTGFQAVAASLPRRFLGFGFTLVALESRREDLYVQLFDHASVPLDSPTATMPATLYQRLNQVIGGAPLVVAGDAAARAASNLVHRPDTILAEDSAPSAAGVLRAALCRRRLLAQSAGPVPLYLRAPDVTFSKVGPPVGR